MRITTIVDALRIGNGARAAALILFFMLARGVSAQSTAIVGATVIDGNGGPPLADQTIVVQDKRITALGARSSVKVPPGATIIDGAGKFLIPGLIDVNNHVTGTSFLKELFPMMLFGEPNAIVKYGYALEAAQMALKFGVTTVRDTYGPLPPLLELRDAIARGDLIGPRLQVAGDIIGWNGGSDGCHGDRPIDRQWCDYLRAYTQVGVELTTMYPEEVRRAIDAYLDKGPDFIKFGMTSHGYRQVNITFSPRVQRVIVDAAHRRGLKVDVHTSNAEGMLLAAEAGVDVITHAGILGRQEVSDEIVRVLRDHHTICALFTNFSVGPVSKLLARAPAAPAGGPDPVAEAVKEMWPYRDRHDRLPRATAAREGEFSYDIDMMRRNDKKLIDGGCIIAVGTDAAPTAWPEISEYVGTDRPFFADPGVATVIAIEGLVTLGMTPGAAIVAGTKHGAMAAGKLDQFGTLEVGKLADLLILGADPLADIRNIRNLVRVMKEGRLIDPATLPTEPRYYRR
jgi:imidazolonepropionase-like amidohydrolase